MPRSKLLGVLAAAAIAGLTGCASAHSGTPPPPATTAHGKPDIRVTGVSSAAAALAAATRFFDLTAAGKYSASYGLLSPDARSAFTESDWARVSAACRPSGLRAYRVSAPDLTGSTVAVTVVSVLRARRTDDDDATGVSYLVSSKPQAFQHIGGQWFYKPTHLSAYRTDDTAVLKRQGICG